MIYIDQLSIRTSFRAYKLARKQYGSIDKNDIKVLDPIKNSPFLLALKKWWRLFGISFSEAEFFAGHQRTSDGESVWISAQNTLYEVAYKAAKKAIDDSTTLSNLNDSWGRNTLLLSLSKYFYGIAGNTGYNTLLKLMVADSISRNNGYKKNQLILGLPLGFTKDFIENMCDSINLHTYSIRECSITKNRISIILLIAFVGLKRLQKQIIVRFKPKTRYGDIGKPALLLLQEDDLSLDRSYRGQPHWIFQNEDPPKFRTLIIAPNNGRFQDCENSDLEKYDVHSLPKDFLYHNAKKHPVKNRIINSLLKLLYISIFGSRTIVASAFHLAIIFVKAGLLTDLCISQNVKAFATGENYYPDATAMNLIGPQINVHTFSYQYSNISNVGPIMMTTADTLCTFSPLFHNRWSQNGIRPETFYDTGYLFDSSFNLLANRAQKVRRLLNAQKSNFVITYFDESVQDNNKYGIIGKNDHYRELAPLMELVISEENIAVIVKSQFQKNSPSVIFGDDRLLTNAVKSRRWLELGNGKHRNNIYPAEAAMASDIVIGHVIGATAGLEAALAGSRCILLNPYNMRGPNIDIFDQADIVYDDIDSAINGISMYRKGVPDFQNIGDWTPIMAIFDPFRDGHSSRRLRKAFEAVFCTSWND